MLHTITIHYVTINNQANDCVFFSTRDLKCSQAMQDIVQWTPLVYFLVVTNNIERSELIIL